MRGAALRGGLAAAIFVALLPLLGLLEVELRVQRVAGLRPLPRESYNLPPPRVLRAMAFGFNEVGADMLWIRTIAYFTDHYASDHDLRHLRLHLSNILELDPHFKPVYRYGAAMMMSQGYRQTNEQVLGAIDLLERGHEVFPEDWLMPFHIGAYYMSELHSRDPAQRARWRRQGADWVRRAAILGADIPWLPGLAAKIYTEQGQRELAIQHLQELFLTTQDDEMKRQIMAKLKDLKAEQTAQRLEQVAQNLERARVRSKMTYVPEDLFLLLRVDPPRPFSLEGLLRAPAGR
jgi:hypothetical protein